MNEECFDCGELIGKKRVRAILNAGLPVETCIDCQSRREKHGHFVRHKLDVQAKMKCGEVDEVNQRLVRGG